MSAARTEHIASFDGTELAIHRMGEGRPVLLLGAAAGLGWRHDGADGQMGIRQELRATLALPLWSKLAVDAGVTAGVGPRPAEEGRPEERWVSRGQLRFGLGLRWGMP